MVSAGSGESTATAARVKSAILWGLVGGVAFLAAFQGYRLFRAEALPIGLGGAAVIAVVITAVVAAIAYAVEYRLRANRRV
ncbi:hypothetical protein SAMN05192561_101157 [Halopenitus malekzadehii]|uniref:DUF7981 domain-containing protein n=1 Tax=Halopenitus malekzadehii TaxID=1267564 RepID=A0A1H6HSX3_9EURY|nr:hypothetical protein [Halopenitus malekzadehii]SEH37254.1 hypothetical protein SAMN05192561_101157 [Halopenitus malekzadehii]